MSINYKNLGLKIREYRKQNNLTQEQLAERCNLSTTFLSCIERGKKKLSLKTLEKLSDILKFEIILYISNKNRDDINEILQECGEDEYKFLVRTLISIKHQLDLYLKYKS